jgi:hypothetical protein
VYVDDYSVHVKHDTRGCRSRQASIFDVVTQI